jgi:hypothetical protein
VWHLYARKPFIKLHGVAALTMLFKLNWLESQPIRRKLVTGATGKIYDAVFTTQPWLQMQCMI